MAIPESPVRSRRAVLAGAFGGIAALAVSALGRPAATDAANGDAVKVGQLKTGSVLTTIDSSASGFKGKSSSAAGSGIIGQSTNGTGFGVNGINTATSGTPTGVRGAATGNGIGVYGNAARGVVGESSGSTGIGVVAKSSATTGTGNGLRALAFSPTAEAVYAENSAAGGDGHAINAVSSTKTVVKVENVSGLTDGVGTFTKAIDMGLWGIGKVGVYGETGFTDASVTNATGVKGEANATNHFGGHFRNINTTGFALRVQGGLRLEGAGGTATIIPGASSVVVTPSIPFRSASFVVATLQTDPGGSVVISHVVVGASSFEIFVTGSVGTNVKVGWIMAN